MNIRDLKYLVALQEHQHFGKAADECHVSQPALSMQLKKLEELLGVKLVERTNKSVLLTDIGSTLAERARLILLQVEELYQLAKLAKDPYSGELKIGVIPTLAPYLLPLIMPLLAKKFPNISFYLVEEQTAMLLDKLKKNKLDAAILAFPVMETYLIGALLFEEKFVLAVPAGHYLAKQKTIKHADLNKQNVLLLEEGHCMREQTLAVCQKMQAAEAHDFRATSLETLRHMVAAGLGITLIPHLAQKSNDGISYIPFSRPQPSRKLGLFWRKTTAKQPLLAELAGHIKNKMTG